MCAWRGEGGDGGIENRTVLFDVVGKTSIKSRPRQKVSPPSLSFFARLVASFAASSPRTYLEADDAPAGGGGRGSRGGLGGVAERSMVVVRWSSSGGGDGRSRGVARLWRRLELHFVRQERAGPEKERQLSAEEGREGKRESERESVKEEEEDASRFPFLQSDL